MPFLDTLERRYGHLAIPGLIRYVAILQVAVYLVRMFNPAYVHQLDLNTEAIRAGQVWRLISFIFVPGGDGILWAVFMPLFMFFLSDFLEQLIGSFRTTLFVFFVMLILGTCTVAGFPLPASMPGTRVLFTNLFLALACAAPRYQINLMGLVPVELRWLALVDLGLIFLSIMTFPDFAATIITGHLPAALFAWPILHRNTGPSERLRKLRGKSPYEPGKTGDAFHTCSRCQRTEISNPELEFRSDEEGNEYCREHLP